MDCICAVNFLIVVLKKGIFFQELEVVIEYREMEIVCSQ
jgi:hypothetical protein